jgi:superfamily II DNA or RNA helicase
MAEKFGLGFDAVTRDQIEASITGNPFIEHNRLILRLDMAARSEELKAKLGAAPEWDLVICDEAHRMAASYFGGEVKETQRYKLSKLLGTRTRNLLLMSATLHNGKEADFQLFMGLLDADRFEGRFREGIHKADVSDMLRRLIKEELYRVDGTPLFPERRAYTAGYALSPEEVDLYQAVTTYVRDEMNRADRTGDGNRRTSAKGGGIIKETLGGETLATRLVELWRADRPHLPVAEIAEGLDGGAGKYAGLLWQRAPMAPCRKPLSSCDRRSQ